MAEYVAAVAFNEPTQTYAGLSKIREVADTGAFRLKSAAIVERAQDGSFRCSEGSDNDDGMRTLGGTLVGMLIGVLGGPIGVLLGTGFGALGGVLFDARRIDRGTDALAEFSKAVPPGTNAILMETEEGTTDALDNTVSRLGGKIYRRDSYEVLAELEAQQKAAEAAAEAAREQMKEAKRVEHKEGLHDRVAALKAKFSHHEDSPNT